MEEYRMTRSIWIRVYPQKGFILVYNVSAVVASGTYIGRIGLSRLDPPKIRG